MATSALARLSALCLPQEIYEQAALVLHQIHTAFAPFLANQGCATGAGLIMGLVAAKARSREQGQLLLDVFKLAEREKLDELADNAARNLHAPVLMDEKAAFSAFHLRMTKTEVEAQPKSGSYNDGWTTGAHAAWFARSDLARAAAQSFQATAIRRATLEINAILVAADKSAMLTAYDGARAYIRAQYDEDRISMADHADLDQDCAHARSAWEEFGPQVG